MVKTDETNEREKKLLQQVFLDAFLDGCEFDAGCRAVQAVCNMAEGEPKQHARTHVGTWLIEDEAFAWNYEKSKRIVERLRYEAAEDFLNKAATGRVTGLNSAQAVAAHMALEAYDRAKWSTKAPVVTKKQKNIPRIEYHPHQGRPKQEKDGKSG